MKKSLVVFLVVALVFALSASVFAAFKDVADDYWASKSIARLAKEKIVTGDGDGNFRPDDYVSRAEFITMLMRIFEPEAKANMSSYKDVDVNAWYYEALAKAVAMPAIQGDSSTKMRPEDNVSRQEAMVIINRIVELRAKNESGLKSFDDYKDVASWAEDSVAALIENKYVNGYPDNTIKPKQYITRAEVAKLIDEIVAMIITDAGEYDLADYDGIVIVKAKNVVLKNTDNIDRIFVLNDDVKDTLTINGKKAGDNDVVVINPKEKEKTSSGGGGGAVAVVDGVVRVEENNGYYVFIKESGNVGLNKRVKFIDEDGKQITTAKLNKSGISTIAKAFKNYAGLDNDMLGKTVAKHGDNEAVRALVDYIWDNLGLDVQTAVKAAGNSDPEGRYSEESMYGLFTALEALEEIGLDGFVTRAIAAANAVYTDDLATAAIGLIQDGE